MIASFPPQRARLVLRVWNGEASVFLGWRPVSCTRQDPAAASDAAKGPSPGVCRSVSVCLHSAIPCGGRRCHRPMKLRASLDWARHRLAALGAPKRARR